MTTKAGTRPLYDQYTGDSLLQALQRTGCSVEREMKGIRRLCRQRFACEADARQALAAFQSPLELLQLAEANVNCSGRDQRRGWFVQALAASNTQILQTYKQQQQAERGIRFFKDPRFQAHLGFDDATGWGTGDVGRPADGPHRLGVYGRWVSIYALEAGSLVAQKWG